MTDETLHTLAADLKRTLLAARNGEGVWEGRLSSSPLATAVAVFALHTADSKLYQEPIRNGLRWLADYQQTDGGWGDAEKLDPANLSSTLLCYAAMRAIAPAAFAAALQKAERWIVGRTGSLEAEKLSAAVYASYGKDRTFAVPILTMCALAGVLGKRAGDLSSRCRLSWRYCRGDSFEN
jgi:squalene-hopene/tetraprenyl-beta-curcumene cyclase